MDLEIYYQSAEWQAKRTRRLEVDEHECRLCGATEQLEVHHKPKCYAQIPHEGLEDLTTLCQPCHREVVTNLIRRRRYDGEIVVSEDVERITPPLERRVSDHGKIEGEDYGRITPPMS